MIRRRSLRLPSINPWHFVWITVLFAEFLTFLLNYAQSYLRWGYLSRELLEIGVIDAFICSAIAAPILIYYLKTANERYLEERERNVTTAHELASSKANFEAIFNSMTDAVIFSDTERRIVMINPAFTEMFGYEPRELLGRTTEVLYAKRADFATIWQQFDHDPLEKQALFEITFRRKDGVSFIAEALSIKVHNAENELLGSLGIARDITERKKVEKSVRETTERLNAVLSASPEAVMSLTPDGTVTLWNKGAERIFGWRSEEVIGRFNPMITRQKTEEFRALRERVLEGESFYGVEVQRRKKDGSSVDISLSTAPLFDDRGDIIGIVAVCTDITERKKAEAELKDYRDHLEELVARRAEEISALNNQLLQSQKLEAVGILAGGVAHEFSNILAAMKGAAYMIQKKLPSDSPVMKYADQIVSSISKATNLSQGLLSFSRRQTISLKPLDINEAVGRIVELLGKLIGEHIELILQPAEKETTIMADANQIEQVLVNLATNAKDAMPDGGRLTIKVEPMEMGDEFIKIHGYGVPGHYVLISVSDVGTGMSEDVRAKIFQPFFTTKMVGKGSGLGLAVTYGIIKQHNGFIDVESSPGAGATFRIYLPTVDLEVVPEQDAGIANVNPGHETILLAEDDLDALSVMSELLEMTGYTVLLAADGEEAVGVFAANRDKIQLVITDVRMPKKNGKAVYDEIRAMAPAAKFLFISGYTADVLDSHGVRQEGLEFISKAARPEELLSKVREVLDS